MLPMKRRHSMLPRWDFFPEFRELQLKLDHLFSDLAGGMPMWDDQETTWTPAVDVLENDEEFLFEVELPGMKREDVKVTVEGDHLVINGERKWNREEEKERIHRKERFYGSFRRELRIPAKVDPDRIEAKFHDGVLEVHMPVLEIAKPRVLEVTAA